MNPGPFSITTTPFVNGAGEAVVVTTDALGRQVSTTLPFYVTGELLKKGYTDYAASFGVLRQRYGISNFDYSKLAYSGSLRYGLTDALTVGSHVEGGKSLTVGGLGATRTAWDVRRGECLLQHQFRQRDEWQANDGRLSIYQPAFQCLSPMGPIQPKLA